LIGARKIKVVDHVDQKQSGLVLVWRAAVEIGIFPSYRDAHF
jgi:hypothetical protein